MKQVCYYYLDEVVKEACIECLGECVACLRGLLTVQGHLNVLGLSTPLTVHRPTGQLHLQLSLIDSQQVRWKPQSCIAHTHTHLLQLYLGRQRQVWLIPIADERVGVQVKL